MTLFQRLMATAALALLPTACVVDASTTTAAPHAHDGGKPHHHAGRPHAHDHADVIPARNLAFPDTRDGRKILVVDLHTHSVFSDGHVWPTVRTWEAERDGLDAMAVTEHLEYQPYRDDIPHPDRNRSYELAAESAARRAERNGDLLIIPGAEITRRLAPGHVNAVFIEDANPLLTIQSRDEDNLENARRAMTFAREQGAFLFWNHPAWPRDFPNGVLEVPADQQALIDDGLLMGIEVANGHYLSEEAMQVALENDLTILGVSDIHGLIDYDYDIPKGEHRTVTLVISTDKSAGALKKGLIEKRTVALYKGQFIGREAEVVTVLSSVLSMTPGTPREGTSIMPLVIRNDAPVDITLRNVGTRNLNNSGDIFTVPAHGEIEVRLNDTATAADAVLTVDVLNSVMAPRVPVKMTLRAE